ncbi:plasmid recombination protein [uncultured Sulfitobacter sp.]|uniref:plasmid recombination protein n=1 Tax=uncultured Sulfitobacter sp. TaxID=191468 RepID=UPI0030DA6E6C|tara:strand:- start:36725 stop:38032 length:1308 start_codon:yes stop_codon:yes gene_type:complete
MDGSQFHTRYPVVLRFEGIGPENIAGYEKHRKRVGGDTGHILEHPPAPNRRLIGSENWAVEALAEIAEIKAQNFAAELEALEQRKRKKDIQKRLAEGPHNPWRPTRHGPMREVILTANKEWFDADPAAVFDEGVEGNQRIANFERLSVAWLKEQFGDDVIHARADLDEEAYHIHAVIMPRVCVEIKRTDKVTGDKKVIATRQMLQPSKFDVIEDYELAQDSVGTWFSEIGLERGEKRKEAFRQAVSQGETPPPKRMHTKTRDWRRKKDRELVRRERDIDDRADAIEERSAEADAIIVITEAIAAGVIDPSANGTAGIAPMKGRENDVAFLRAQSKAQQSPVGAARVAQAFRRGWGAMLKKASADAIERVSDEFRAANRTLDEATSMLAKIGAALGDGFTENVGALSELTQRLKKAVIAGNLSHERTDKKKFKQRQ